VKLTTPLVDFAAEISEIQRLNHLLSLELRLPIGYASRSQVAIVRAKQINPPLITTKKTKQDRLEIQIDFIPWQELSIDRRDLFFWHEVARIESKTFSQFDWEISVITVGLGLSLIEVTAHNIISLSAVLVAVALASHQLYQRNCGEGSMRRAVAADRRAIQLATQSGYSLLAATTSLSNALKWLAKFANKSDWRKYQVRLRALEMLATAKEHGLSPSHQDLEFSSQ
jgi:hypothetical protein